MTPASAAFEEEHLELLPQEVAEIGRLDGGGGGGGGSSEDEA